MFFNSCQNWAIGLTGFVHLAEFSSVGVSHLEIFWSKRRPGGQSWRAWSIPPMPHWPNFLQSSLSITGWNRYIHSIEERRVKSELNGYSAKELDSKRAVVNIASSASQRILKNGKNPFRFLIWISLPWA